MIFKTFDNDLTGLINKVGLFNKSLYNIGRDFRNGNGLFTSLFSGQSVTSKDIQSINAMNQAMKNGSTMAQSWQMHMTACTAAAKQQATQCLINKGNLSDLTSELNQNTISAKAGQAALRGLAIAGNMLIGWAISEVISGLVKLTQVSKDVAESAKELSDSFKNAKSEISDYKYKIEELYSTINNSSSSIEDVTEARKSLLSLQDELIDKFGTEESVINNVTDAINGQTEALDELSKLKWQETKNEFNSGGFWNDLANFFQGTDNIGRMLTEYGEQDILFPWVEYAGSFNKLTDEMVAKLENIGIDIKVGSGDLQLIRDFDSLTESIQGKKDASLYISGNAEEIYNKILALQKLANEDDSFGELYKNLERHANHYKDLTDNYKEFYNQYVLFEKILTKNSSYTDTFKNITDAAEKYNEAFASGDEGKIKETADEYANTVSTAMATAIANGDSDIATYFENMYPTLKSIVDGWNFNLAFDSNTDNLQGKVQTVLAELKDENDRSLTVEEILGLGESNAQYQALVAIAHDYNMTIEEMIELLKKRNLVSAMDYQGLVGLFGQDYVDKLSPEDLEIAYTIKNVGKMTFEQLQAEIQKVKDSANNHPTSFDFPTHKDQIDDIQSSISTLRSALDSFNQGTLDESAVLDLMQQFPDLIPYIDLAADGFGNLSEGLSTLIAQQPDSLIQSLQTLKSSLATDEERQQVDLLIDSLQRLSSYGDSGIEAYATAIGNTWGDTANVIESVAAQFENLAKIQEYVANGLTITATAAAELAKTYPEILDHAQVTADGQITLNEEIVKNILDGDKSIVDAQIAKLEADKAELTAKKEFAEAQLNIAKQVGEGEGK